MNRLMSRHNLLAVVAILVLIRFLVMPVFSWQQDQLLSLKVKTQQLSRLTFLIENQHQRQEKNAHYKDLLSRASDINFRDQDGAKLHIQKQVENIFDSNSVTMSGFDWILDSEGSVRRLRASVKFKGSSTRIIKTFWDLSRHEKFMRQLDWKFRFKSVSSKTLGSASGSIILEFYALPENHAAEEQTATLAAVGPDKGSEL
jgi:hypothetical protein